MSDSMAKMPQIRFRLGELKLSSRHPSRIKGPTSKRSPKTATGEIRLGDIASSVQSVTTTWQAAPIFSVRLLKSRTTMYNCLRVSR